MGRPVGVTILAILYYLGALFCILGALGSFVGGGYVATLISQQSSGGGGAGFLAGAGAVMLGVSCLVAGAIDGLLGWGLWKLKNWARIITIIFAVIGAAFQLFGLLAVFAHFNVMSLVFTLLFLAISGLIIWYLLQASVSAAFRGQARAASA
jgi:hypothetical protein